MHVWNAETIMSINLNSEAAQPKNNSQNWLKGIYLQQTHLLIGRQFVSCKNRTPHFVISTISLCHLHLGPRKSPMDEVNLWPSLPVFQATSLNQPSSRLTRAMQMPAGKCSVYIPNKTGFDFKQVFTPTKSPNMKYVICPRTQTVWLKIGHIKISWSIDRPSCLTCFLIAEYQGSSQHAGNHKTFFQWYRCRVHVYRPQISVHLKTGFRTGFCQWIGARP